MSTSHLILKRASGSRSSGQWSDEDYDVLADGIVIGRVMTLCSGGGQGRGLRTNGSKAVADQPFR
jgi:hypothetical protein